jgi:hypothetical protein
MKTLVTFIKYLNYTYAAKLTLVVLCLTVFDRGIQTASCDGMLTCYWFNYS